MIKISPAEGRRVRCPDRSLLEPGTEVTGDTYWLRRLADGDVMFADPKKEAKK